MADALGTMGGESAPGLDSEEPSAAGALEGGMQETVCTVCARTIADLADAIIIRRAVGKNKKAPVRASAVQHLAPSRLAVPVAGWPGSF